MQMIKSSKPNSTVTDKPHRAAILLLVTMADTTWRMFLPTIGSLLFGMWMDQTLKTKIIFTLIFTILGFALGMYLVVRQLKRVNK